MAKSIEEQLEVVLDEYSELVGNGIEMVFAETRKEYVQHLNVAILNGNRKASLKWSSMITAVDELYERLFNIRTDYERGLYGAENEDQD